MNPELKVVSQHDIVTTEPPDCWQAGFLMGNGALGAVFFAPAALQWIVNKTDVLDARTQPVRRILPPDEARRMAHEGATVADFTREESPENLPEGAGPKSCCQLTMELGFLGGAGHPSLPGIAARLNLADATVRVELDKHLFHPRVESFVDAHSNVLAIRVTEVSSLVNNVTRLIFTRPEDLQMNEPSLTLEKDRILMNVDLPKAGHYIAGIQLVPRRGTAHRDLMQSRIRPKYHVPEVGLVKTKIAGRFGFLTVGGDFDVFIAVATTRDAVDPTAEVHHLLDEALQRDWKEYHQAHSDWWSKFWSRSTLELEDKSLEREFYRSLYALGSTYRTGRTPIAGLCGLSYGPDIGPIQVTPWNGDLHHDLNVECPFFPVFALNHGDLADAYLDTYLSFLPEARKLAHDVWHCSGAHFSMCVNALGRPIDGGVGTYRFFFGGSYVALIYCQAWRFQRNAEQMRVKILPFLREIIAFYQNLATRNGNGVFHWDPAHAPEINLINVSDPVQLVSMLRICLATAIEGSALLGEDPVERGQWEEMLQHLPSYPIAVDARGRTVIVDAVGIPADECVSQAGCLLPVYPCNEVDYLSEDKLLTLYQATFDSVLEKCAYFSYAIEQGRFLLGGHPIFFCAMTALRLGRRDEFWKEWMPMFLRACSKPNGLMSHNAAVVADPALTEKNLDNIPDETLDDVSERMPKWEPWHGHNGYSSPNPRSKELSEPLIEANADFLTMLTESLLQSHNGVIRVFPAWPKHLDARFDDFVAEGNILVSASFCKECVEYVKLRQQPGSVQKVLFLSPWTGKTDMLTLTEDHELILSPGIEPVEESKD